MPADPGCVGLDQSPDGFVRLVGDGEKLEIVLGRVAGVDPRRAEDRDSRATDIGDGVEAVEELVGDPVDVLPLPRIAAGIIEHKGVGHAGEPRVRHYQPVFALMLGAVRADRGGEELPPPADGS